MTPGDGAAARPRRRLPLPRKHKSGRGRIVIGKDTRLSGYLFETALAAGICSMGADVMLCGPLPTPGIAFITSSMRADAGVVISASHNPFEDNGIKIFAADGFKLPDEVEARLEELMALGRSSTQSPARRRDRQGDQDRGLARPLRRVPEERLPAPPDARRAARSSSTAPTAPPTRSRRRCSPSSAPTSSRSAHAPTAPTSTTTAARCTRRKMQRGGEEARRAPRHRRRRRRRPRHHRDENGEEVDGDTIMAMCARRMIERGELKKKTLVTTVMSNLGLERSIARAGRQAGARAGRRPLRRRGDAHPRLQLRRRAVGAPGVPRPHDDRRRRAGGAAGAGGDARERQAAVGAARA